MRLRRFISAQVPFCATEKPHGIARPPGLLHNMLYTGTAMIAQRFDFQPGSSAAGVRCERPVMNEVVAAG